MNPSDTRAVPNWRVYVPMFICLLGILALAFLIFRYFLLTFTVALSLALMLGPAQRQLTRRLRGWDSVAAALLVLLCTVLMLLPLLSYGTLLAQQAVDVSAWLRPRLEPSAMEKLWQQTQARYPLLMAWMRQITGGNTMNAVSAVLTRIASGANHWIQSAVAGIANALIDIGILLMMLFFLLRDGDQLRDALRGISPFTRGQETEVLDHLTKTVKGTLQSIVIVPLIQGLLAMLGFWLLGLPSPLFWGIMVPFAGLIPLVGTPLVWVPAAGYFFLVGAPGRGLALVLYGTVVISGIDNVLKPIILKGAAQIHTMLAFLSILGGLYAFGPKGLIAGPVILSLVLSAYRIYRYDVLRWRALPAEPAPAAGEKEVEAVAAGG